MWASFYPPARRKSSASSIKYHPGSPPVTNSQPYDDSALVESPDFTSSQFNTPPTIPSTAHPRIPGSDSLPPVDETPGGAHASGGSIHPLIARDFASSTRTQGQVEEEDEDGETASDSFVVVPADSSVSLAVPSLRPPPPPRNIRSVTANPFRIPPVSVHDSYVSKHISPISAINLAPTQPPSPSNPDHPPILRASSATDVPQSTATKQLLPSPLVTSNTLTSEKGKPIFDIFDADLSAPAEDMVRALKGHLEEVLKVQEEIGRMHLNLEKLAPVKPETWDVEPSEEPRTPPASNSTPGRVGMTTGTSRATSGKATPINVGFQKGEAEEALLKRAKGVDEIMEKLGALSERLRTYHHLGTPRLNFPQTKGTLPASREKSRTKSIDPAQLIPGVDSTPHPPQSLPSPSSYLSPTPPTSPTSPGRVYHPSPLGRNQNHVVGKRSSSSTNLSMVNRSPREQDRSGSGFGNDSADSPTRGRTFDSMSPPLGLKDVDFGDSHHWGEVDERRGEKEVQDKGEDAWNEHTQSPKPRNRLESQPSLQDMGRTESPVEI